MRSGSESGEKAGAMAKKGRIQGKRRGILSWRIRNKVTATFSRRSRVFILCSSVLVGGLGVGIVETLAASAPPETLIVR